MLTKNCIICSKQISSVGKSKTYWLKVKYCSTKCSGKGWLGHKPPKSAFKNGSVPWNKDRKHSAETIKKLTLANNLNKKFGEDNIHFKGDEASYSAIHQWVVRHKQRPKQCEYCGEEKNYPLHWANIDHLYKRNLDDYVALCARCHKRYDLQNGLCTH